MSGGFPGDGHFLVDPDAVDDIAPIVAMTGGREVRATHVVHGGTVLRMRLDADGLTVTEPEAGDTDRLLVLNVGHTGPVVENPVEAVEGTERARPDDPWAKVVVHAPSRTTMLPDPTSIPPVVDVALPAPPPVTEPAPVVVIGGPTPDEDALLRQPRKRGRREGAAPLTPDEAAE